MKLFRNKNILNFLEIKLFSLLSITCSFYNFFYLYACVLIHYLKGRNFREMKILRISWFSPKSAKLSSPKTFWIQLSAKLNSHKVFRNRLTTKLNFHETFKKIFFIKIEYFFLFFQKLHKNQIKQAKRHQ